jgi:asparagine synthase (glutamine-hydrolysing)
MFRYLCFAWDDSHPTDSARALRLAEAVQAGRGWDAALVRSGLQVFTTGTRSGINGVYPLQGNGGVVLGKIFSRRELTSAPRGELTITDAEAEQIRQSSGRALVRNFWGRYVAFLSAASGSTCVVRDPSATLPCYWMRRQGIMIVFSWLEDALELFPSDEAPCPNWRALEAFLWFGSLGGRETALEGVSQLLAGEALDLRTERSTLLWSAIDIARSPTTDSAAEAEVLLSETVRCTARAWAACYDTILLRLSGGVDSSILLSCLATGSTRADVVCVNYHSAGSNSDERSFARLAAAKAGRDLIERHRDEDFRIERLSTIARMPAPTNHVGWMNAHIDARLAAAHSADALFTGAGGDALFYEFPRWWPAADYLQVKGWNFGFAAAVMDAARLGRVSIWRAIALALAERVRPTAAARELIGDASAFFCEGFLVETLQQGRFLHPHLRRAALPVGKFVQTASLMHPLGYYDPFEQAAAPELVNPLLSQPLVELALGLPTYVLTEGGHGRALARRAFAADIPRQIAARRSKGGMEEHVKHVLLSNLDFARGMLLEGELVRRNLLDRGKVEVALSGKPTAHRGALGQLNMLLATEVWLSRCTR